MKNVIKFRCYDKICETDLTKSIEEDEMDENLFLNVTQKNWDYLKSRFSEEQLLEIIKKNPSWMEFSL